MTRFPAWTADDLIAVVFGVIGLAAIVIHIANAYGRPRRRKDRQS